MEGSDKAYGELWLMVLNFVTMNSVMKRYNLKRGEISEVTESCNFKRFVGDACG